MVTFRDGVEALDGVSRSSLDNEDTKLFAVFSILASILVAYDLTAADGEDFSACIFVSVSNTIALELLLSGM